MDGFAEKVSNLHLETQQIRYEFLLAELEVCHTTVEFGTMELERGNIEFAHKEALIAATGLNTIETFARHLDSVELQTFIFARLQGLIDNLKAFQSKLVQRSSA